MGPSSVGGWLWLAVTRDNRGQEAEAIPAYREALSLGVSQVNTRAQAWTWLASSVSKTGRHAEALGALAEADSIGGYERRGHLSVRMTGHARSHGSSSCRVDAHDHVAAGGTAPL